MAREKLEHSAAQSVYEPMSKTCKQQAMRVNTEGKAKAGLYLAERAAF
jgi:hypothetical protein